MQIKWYFWLQRWKNVMRYFIDELAFNLILSSEAINSIPGLQNSPDPMTDDNAGGRKRMTL